MDRPIGYETWPTPLHRADNLSRELGIELRLKREDLSPIGLGGNKVRKLARIFQAIEAGKYDVVITTGAKQSNHCRLTAAFATRRGLPCHLVLRGDSSNWHQGNLLLDRLLGATCHFRPSGLHEDADTYVSELANSLREQGKKPFVIPVGGNSRESVEAFEECAREISDQTGPRDAPDTIVVAFGSGSTYAGLLLGALKYLPGTKVIGISVASSAAEAGRKLKEHLRNVDADPTTTYRILDQYVGEGYGIASALSKAALQLMARHEGVFLDPTYTAKAFAGLVGQIEDGLIEKGQSVVFVHTGGVPSLFAASLASLGLDYDADDTKTEESPR